MIYLALALVALAAGVVLAARALAESLVSAAAALGERLPRVLSVEHAHSHALHSRTVADANELRRQTVEQIASEAKAIVRLAQLGVADIPRAQALQGTPDPEVEARAAMRQRTIERGADELERLWLRTGVHGSRELALQQAEKMIASVEATP